MTEKKVMKLASRGKRLGAALIDAAFPMIAYIVFGGILAANGLGNTWHGLNNGFGYGYGYGYGYDYGYDIGRRLTGISAFLTMSLFFMLIVYVIVECVLFAKGKSIGKAILGLQVVSSENGNPFGFWKMMFREFIVKNACGSVFALGYIWVLIDEKNRGWHDKILDSYVVDLKESEKINLQRIIAYDLKNDSTDINITEDAGDEIPE